MWFVKGERNSLGLFDRVYFVCIYDWLYRSIVSTGRRRDGLGYTQITHTKDEYSGILFKIIIHNILFVSEKDHALALDRKVYIAAVIYWDAVVAAERVFYFLSFSFIKYPTTM